MQLDKGNLYLKIVQFGSDHNQIYFIVDMNK